MPNISASVPQIKGVIEELRSQGYDLPDYPEAPQTDEEKSNKAKYDVCKGSAVNPVLRQGNSDRRAATSVKNYAKSNPHKMGAWSKDSKTNVASMMGGDFFSNEKSATITEQNAGKGRIEFVAEDGGVTVLKDGVPLDKDAVVDAETTGEFVANIATFELREPMNVSAVSAPHEVDEFEYAGLTKMDSEMVKCPRVAESPIHLECRYLRSVTMLTDDSDHPNTVVFGEVIGVHIDDGVVKNGLIDIETLRPIGRLGYLDFVEVNNSFSMDRPNWNPSQQTG